MSDFSAEIELSAPKISLLEPLKIKVHLTYPKEYEPDLNAMRANLARQFNLLSEKVSPDSVEWSVEARGAGKTVVTLYKIPFHSKDKTVEVISPFYPLEVYLPKVDLAYEGELAPLLTFDKYQPLAISPENIRLETPDRHAEKIDAKTFSYTSLFVLCLPLILGMAAYYFLSKPAIRKKIAAIGQQDPEEAALHSLHTIDLEKLPEKEYYTKMSAIVRRFIEQRYQVNARAYTSQEFLQKLHIQKEEQEVLQTFFEEADQVKYAHHAPTSEEKKVAAASARRFISFKNN